MIGFTDNEEFNNFFKEKLNETELTEVKIPYFKQKRINKNSRINNKWIKKYGYSVLYKQVKAKVLTVNAEDYPKGLFNPNTEITFTL